MTTVLTMLLGSVLLTVIRARHRGLLHPGTVARLLPQAVTADLLLSAHHLGPAVFPPLAPEPLTQVAAAMSLVTLLSHLPRRTPRNSSAPHDPGMEDHDTH